MLVVKRSGWLAIAAKEATTSQGLPIGENRLGRQENGQRRLVAGKRAASVTNVLVENMRATTADPKYWKTLARKFGGLGQLWLHS